MSFFGIEDAQVTEVGAKMNDGAPNSARRKRGEGRRRRTAATTWVHHLDSNVCRFHVVRPLGGGGRGAPPPAPPWRPAPRGAKDDIIYEGDLVPQHHPVHPAHRANHTASAS